MFSAGILADSKAVLVKRPGVGFPSGVIGIYQLFYNIHSEDILHKWI